MSTTIVALLGFGFKIERNTEDLVRISRDSKILAAAFGTGLVGQKVKAFLNMGSSFEIWI